MDSAAGGGRSGKPAGRDNVTPPGGPVSGIATPDIAPSSSSRDISSVFVGCHPAAMWLGRCDGAGFDGPSPATCDGGCSSVVEPPASSSCLRFLAELSFIPKDENPIICDTAASSASRSMMTGGRGGCALNEAVCGGPVDEVEGLAAWTDSDKTIAVEYQMFGEMETARARVDRAS